MYDTSNRTKDISQALGGQSCLTRADGKVIALVSRDRKGRLFAEKHRFSASKHMLRTPPAIALDITALEQAERFGIAYIRATDRESGATWCTETWRFRRHGFDLCRGFGPQRALPLAFWYEATEPPGSYPMPETLEPTGKPAQDSLFAGVL